MAPSSLLRFHRDEIFIALLSDLSISCMPKIIELCRLKMQDLENDGPNRKAGK